MKSRICVAVLFACLLCTGAFSQQQEETVTVPKSMLSKEQIGEISAKELQQKIDTYGKWVGMGHEVGTAVNESLSAVTAQANNFAQTGVGKWTMFVVIYKIIGHDVLGCVFATIFWFVGVPIWLWSYRRYLPHKYLKRKTFDPTGKIVLSEEWGTTETTDERNGWCIGHWLILALMIVVGCVAIFS